uniref:Uncharacterized protein n=1 Tax=Anguilla anguilla TaxID=7936 RepID=A0A0E9R3U5_ANGAN
MCMNTSLVTISYNSEIKHIYNMKF